MMFHYQCDQRSKSPSSKISKKVLLSSLLVLLSLTSLKSLAAGDPEQTIQSYRVYDSTDLYPNHNFYNQLLDCAGVGDSNLNSALNNNITGDNSSVLNPITINNPGLNNTGGANNSGTGTITLDPMGNGSGSNPSGLYNGNVSATPGSINYNPGVVTEDKKISLEQIVNIGNLIWNIVDMGRVNARIQTYRAHALPKGVVCWTDLENWQIPTSKVFTVEYKNMIGQVVANYSYRISYIYGGNINGVGKYIANLTVSPVDFRVKWGFNFSSEVQIPAPFNLGSKQNPMAAMQVFVYWSIGNALKVEQRSSLYYVTGDGKIKLTDE